MGKISSSHQLCMAVIPARGGSVRVPCKNIRDLCGKPAIAYTIEAAIQSRLFARVVVSTESDEIASIAKRFGAESPFLHDATLADDYTPVSLVTHDALCQLDRNGREYRHVARLMPNCPLRTAEDIRGSYQQFIETGDDSAGILEHGCFHKPENLGVDEGTIWGDYYFIEAMTKAGVI